MRATSLWKKMCGGDEECTLFASRVRERANQRIEWIILSNRCPLANKTKGVVLSRFRELSNFVLQTYTERHRERTSEKRIKRKCYVQWRNKRIQFDMRNSRIKRKLERNGRNDEGGRGELQMNNFFLLIFTSIRRADVDINIICILLFWQMEKSRSFIQFYL